MELISLLPPQPNKNITCATPNQTSQNNTSQPLQALQAFHLLIIRI